MVDGHGALHGGGTQPRVPLADVSQRPIDGLANEVAITEYAIAVSSELVTSSIYTDASDYIFEIRKTINRLSRKLALTT